MKETMTIHKALAELKLLDKRIGKAIDELNVVTANKHSSARIEGQPVAQYVEEAKKAYQSVLTLISRRDAIKRGVTRSNATAIVNIGGKEYTVAEAIDMKAKGVDYLKELKERLTTQYIKAKRLADHENGERLDSRADDYVKSLYQGADVKKLADEIQKVRDTFIAAQTVEVVDPIGVSAEIDRLQNEIDAFMADVDSALSVSNALTTIEIEYETK